MTNETNAGDAAGASRMAEPDNADAAAAPVATAKAGSGEDKGGLSSVPHIVELADQLSACADELHERIMRDLRAYDGRPVPARIQATARALLEDELILRQRANGLYADAATFIVKSLGKSQQGIMALTGQAAEKIRKIALIGDVTGLVGGLLLLAGSVTTGQPAGILTALDKINTQLKAIKSHRAPAAASTPKPS